MFNTGERVAAFFDCGAEVYETRATKGEHFPFAWIPRHIQDIEAVDQCQVLDLGCGIGLNVKLLSERRGGIRAEGIDISPKALELARTSNRYDRLYARDLTKPLPDISSESFDLVIAISFLDFLTEAEVGTCLSECHRVLKPNGTLWASFRRFEWEDEGSPPRVVSVNGIHLIAYSAGEILNMLQRAGLYLIGLDALTGYITRTGFPCPYYVVRARKLQ